MLSRSALSNVTTHLEHVCSLILFPERCIASAVECLGLVVCVFLFCFSRGGQVIEMNMLLCAYIREGKVNKMPLILGAEGGGP